MRAILGDVRDSLWRDFMDRVEEKGIDLKDFRINEHEMSCEYLPTGNTIQSKGFKKSSGARTAKLKSIAGATDVLIEECDEVSKEDFEMLDDTLRTTKAANVHIYRAWNPPHKDHWIIKDYYNLTPSNCEGFFIAKSKRLPDHLSIFRSYQNNLINLSTSFLNKIERYKHSLNRDEYEWYLSNYMGLVSSGVQGRVYKDYQLYDDLPDDEYYRLFGLDFGFTNDPTALVELNINKSKRRVYIKQHVYETGLTTPQIIIKVRNVNHENDEVIADSAERRVITEMVMSGINCIPAKKGKGSIEAGITTVKSWELFVHKDSSDVQYELENYTYVQDQNKELTNKPIDDHNHCLDGVRYGLTYYNSLYG